MRYKLLLLVFFALFLPMNLYSRALRHISISDVKKKHNQKLADQIIKEEKEKQEKKYLNHVMEKKRYNWRKELTEQMTTSDVFFTTLPATGDVNLAYPDWNVTGGQDYSVSGNSVTITGDPDVQNGFVALFDTTVHDTIVFDVSGSNILLGILGNGTKVITSSGTYSVSVSPESTDTLIFTLAPGSGNTTVSNLRYQRRTPLNVFVSLDSPEATSFIRTGSGDLSPAEKQKKLKKMLEASDEYVRQMYGDEFPGTSAVPPGEAGDTPGIDIQDFQIASEPLRGQKTDVKYDPKMKMFVPRPSEKDEADLIQTLVKNA